MTRYATHADIPHIVEMARTEHSRSPWAEYAFDAEHVTRTCGEFICGFGRTLIVSESGYLAGLVQPVGFSRALNALEYAWYAEDGKGMSLLAEFEQWARNMNASHLTAHDYIGDGRLASVLERRRGYRRIGCALTKRLEH